MTRYARLVVAKEIIAGPDVRAACRRHLKDLREGHKRGLVWRLDKALHAINFFPGILKHKNGTPFVLALWQKFIVGSLFGWYGVDGFRRFRKAFIEIGKGNGKSPLAAGIGIYMMVADGEPFAEVYAAGKHKEQAMVSFRSAVAMVDQSPILGKRIRKFGGENTWQLTHRESGSFFKAISNNTTSGPRIHCAIVDEIHEHPNRELLSIIEKGVEKCQRSLIVEITNSGVDRTSICYEHHEYSGQVVRGTLEENDDSWFAYVCGLDEGDDPLEDESCWIKANPNLEVSIFVKELRMAVVRAKGMPAAQSDLLRLNFCEWVDAASPWIGADLWMACEVEHLKPLELWRGKDAYLALDLSGTLDLTALAMVFPNVFLPGDPVPVTGVRVELYTPKDTLVERSRRDRVPYNVWVDAGEVIATPGRSVDYAFVVERLKLLATIVNIKRIACDPYRMKDFERELEQAGLDIELVAHPQGVKQSAETGLWMPRSIELAEQEISGDRLVVEPNRCLRWNVAGAICEQDAKENRYFRKRKNTGRIDGAVAMVMGIGAALAVPPPKDSVYETRGVLVI